MVCRAISSVVSAVGHLLEGGVYFFVDLAAREDVYWSVAFNGVNTVS